jgi:hypothetical protein
MNETDTRAKLVDPWMYSSGWTNDQIFREVQAGLTRADYMLQDEHDDVLTFDGAEWIAAAPSGGGGGDLTWTAITGTGHSDPGEGGPYEYAKDSNNRVHLRGFRNGGGGTVSGFMNLATLPSGYRPANVEYFTIYSEDGSGYVSGRMRVKANGDIDLMHGTGLSRVSFSGVSFSAAP